MVENDGQNFFLEKVKMKNKIEQNLDIDVINQFLMYI